MRAFEVPNVANVFTPDLSKGLNQLVFLTADSTLNRSINGPTDSSVDWTLIVDQDGIGGWNLIVSPEDGYTYKVNLLGTAAPLTRSQSNWTHDQAGHNSLSGMPVSDQPIKD
jgi:hypothetical protein